MYFSRQKKLCSHKVWADNFRLTQRMELGSKTASLAAQYIYTTYKCGSISEPQSFTGKVHNDIRKFLNLLTEVLNPKETSTDHNHNTWQYTIHNHGVFGLEKLFKLAHKMLSKESYHLRLIFEKSPSGVKNRFSFAHQVEKN